MTIAWYGHLKYKSKPLILVILASWGIAFFEYIFQVPANRFGHAQFNVAQLKIIQEVIALSVFIPFAIFVMKEGLRWNYVVSFLLIVTAVFFVFHDFNH
jgi:uncharacterized protein (DUF486 family)